MAKPDYPKKATSVGGERPHHCISLATFSELVKNLQNELPVKRSILAKFAAYQPNHWVQEGKYASFHMEGV